MSRFARPNCLIPAEGERSGRQKGEIYSSSPARELFVAARSKATSHGTTTTTPTTKGAMCLRRRSFVPHLMDQVRALEAHLRKQPFADETRACVAAAVETGVRLGTKTARSGKELFCPSASRDV